MAETTPQLSADFNLPRPISVNHSTSIAAPSYQSFTATFGTAFPKPQFITSEIGSTAVYDLPPPSTRTRRHVLIIHGGNTPALGMWPLSKELQTRDPDSHIVNYDIWGHGLSSTPLQAHTPHLFHAQILQVMGFMRWTSAHIIGYSFGGSTAVSFATYNPWAALSVVLLAPAGLFQKGDIDSHLQGLLDDSRGREQEARDCVLSWLEGPPLVVPDDWRVRMHRGEVVAEALRYWELQEHHGYPYSALSMVRDGGVLDQDAVFRKFGQLPIKKLTLIGDSDVWSNVSQLAELGIHDVSVIENAGHQIVRSHPVHVADLVSRFWAESVSER